MQNGNWHLDKRVSLGTIFSIIVISLGGFASYKDLQADVGDKADKDDVAVIKQDIAVIRAEQRAISDDVNEIKDALKIIAQDVKRNREDRSSQ